jgi:predicted CopG family antitoxin
MIRKNIYLGLKQIKDIQKLSDHLGISFSELIRRAIDYFLKHHKE